MSDQPPPAAGVRLPWEKMPSRLRSALTDWLGAPIAEVTMQPGGFSPGVTARVTTSEGRRVFVKAVGPELNPDSPDIYRREAEIVASLPHALPVPRLLWTHDEGDGGWIVEVFEYIDGWNPVQPWRTDELDRVLETLVSLSAMLTPSPIDAEPASEVFAIGICGWQQLEAEPLEGLDTWSTRHLNTLAGLEAQAPEAVKGDTLLHFDIRADNLVLTPDRVYVVDWPSACVGAAWVDMVGFAPSVAMQGGPQPEELLRRHPATRNADRDRLTAAVASVAGYFTQRSLLPPPPGLPTLRAFQAAQGVEARRWLALRLGLEVP